MKIAEVSDFKGLVTTRPQYQMKPAEAVTAQYVDPFRADFGKLCQCFGFKDKKPSNWDTVMNPGGADHYVLAAFILGGIECIIEGIKTAGVFGTISGYYIHPTTGALTVLATPNINIGITPSRALIDPGTYFIGNRATTYSEIFQIFLWGQNDSPKRLLLKRDYTNSVNTANTWSILPMDTISLSDYPLTTIETSATDGGSWDFYDHTFYYLFVFEDVMGNYYYQTSFYDDYVGGVAPVPPAPLLPPMAPCVKLSDAVILKYGINKMHIYRINATDNPLTATVGTAAWTAELFLNVRWRATVDVAAPTLGSPYVYIDTDGSEDVLGDNLSMVQSEMIAMQTNAKNALDAAGFHNGALWLARKDEVQFSQYDLTSTYGTRLLMFPGSNTWKFEGIGDIVDLQSLDNYLIVFGTQGIKVLGGDYIDNFYERYLGQVSLIKPDQDKDEYIKQTLLIGNSIYFVDTDGIPHVFRDSSYAPLPDIIIPKIADVSTAHVSTWRPFDMMQFRNGWLISNGSTCYLYDIANERWVEWPQAIRFFVANQDPFGETATTLDDAAPEYEYFKFYPSSRATGAAPPKVYATDGTLPTMTWRSPLIQFDKIELFKLMFINWRYNLDYGYGQKQIGSVAKTAALQTLTLNLYIDDLATAVKTVALAPDELAEGEYQEITPLNLRGRKLSFEITSANIPFMQINGIQIRFEDRGLKSYE